MATIFASMAKGRASQTTNPSLGGSSSTPPPTTFTPPPSPIPIPQQNIPIDMFNTELAYVSDWDHDTDTLASFLVWKSKLDHTTTTNNTTERLLEPICRFICAEMTHQFAKQSVTVKIPGLKEMKERDLEMQKQISQLTNTITKLSEQIATLSARPIPAATPAAPRVVSALPQQRQKPPTTTKPPPDPAPTYAQVAEKQPREFTEVRSKKKARKETILPKPYRMADRLIIFSLTTAPNNRKEAADRALQVANKTITTHAEIEHPPLILANNTATNNLVFTVAPQHLSTSYEPYLAILEEALHEFPIALSRVSQRWTRFIVHGIPTTATPESACTEIESSYPSLRMGQTPHWFTSSERHQGKEASSMIINFIGEMTKKSLSATSLAMFNREWTIAEYITFGPATQCNKCQTCGYPTQCCTTSNHTCAVCAQPHPTKDHPGAITNCRDRSAVPTAYNHTKPPTKAAPPMSRSCWKCAATTRQPLTRRWPPRECPKGKGIVLPPLPKFPSTASLLYNVPT